MRWVFCQDCHIDGCCENQDRGNKCEVYAKKITEKCEELEKQIKELQKQLEISIEGLMTILNDGDDYWDKCQAQYYLAQIKELDK